ncbi:GntR family transcriptional regulator [Zongyangia hominis]|nr:GntR family transcriptional regulator [Zongyangia hominis]
MDEQDFAILTRLAEQPDPEDQMRLFCYILQKAQNPLVMNLFWESTLYLGLPFPMEDKGHRLYDAETSRKRLKELISAGRDQNPEHIYEAHLAFQLDVSKQIISYINARIPEQPNIEPLPFVWKVYRDRPEICGSLAIRVIHDVYLGDFQGMEFLPSYEKLAGKYGVSVSTMRRTIGVLNQLGATQSINGKGTRILMLSGSEIEQTPDLTIPKIRRNMAYYLQSFELLAESCKGVMRMALQAFSEKERAELVDLLEGYLRNKRYYISPQSIFAFVAEHSPLQVIEEIYGKLYGLNLWGYPMAKYRKEMPGLDQTLIAFTQAVIAAVLENDAERFSQTVHAFMQSEYRIAKDILIEHGYEPEDLSSSPSFSLLSTEETAQL